MGILKKLAKFFHSNANALLDQIEDKQKLSDLAILELENNKKKAKKLLASALAAVKMANLRKSELLNSVGALMKEAEAFLRANDEETAKNRLEKKQHLTREIENLTAHIENEKQAIEAISRGLDAVDKKIANFKTREALNASKEELEKTDAFDTFSRMEEKIEQTEREVLALKELLAIEEKETDKEKSTPKSYDKTSDPAALLAEIEALKKKLKDA